MAAPDVALERVSLAAMLFAAVLQVAPRAFGQDQQSAPGRDPLAEILDSLGIPFVPPGFRERFHVGRVEAPQVHARRMGIPLRRETAPDRSRDGGEKGTIEEQTELVVRNVLAVVEAAGSSLDRAVKTTVYVEDIGLWGRVDTVYANETTGRPAPSCPSKSSTTGAPKRLRRSARIDQG